MRSVQRRKRRRTRNNYKNKEKDTSRGRRIISRQNKEEEAHMGQSQYNKIKQRPASFTRTVQEIDTL